MPAATSSEKRETNSGQENRSSLFPCVSLSLSLSLSVSVCCSSPKRLLDSFSQLHISRIGKNRTSHTSLLGFVVYASVCQHLNAFFRMRQSSPPTPQNTHQTAQRGLATSLDGRPDKRCNDNNNTTPILSAYLSAPHTQPHCLP